MAKFDYLPEAEIISWLDSLPDELDKAIEAGRLLAQAQNLQRVLKSIRQQAVNHLYEEAGMSYDEIAKNLGLTRARAYQLALGQKPGKPRD